MNLEELQTARDRERQTDKLQQLRESFYADAGGFIQQLRTERERAAERADDPFDAPEVNQLTDEIDTAEQTVEAIYEKRVGKIVKAASFAAADLPAEAEGMTAEEQKLFETLVADIKQNRQHVLDVLAGENSNGPAGEADDQPNPEAGTPATGESAPAESPAAGESTPPEPDVSAADLMGTTEEDGPADRERVPPERSGEGHPPDQPPAETAVRETEDPGTDKLQETEPTGADKSPDANPPHQGDAVRNDGGQPTTVAGGPIDRRTVRITDDVGTFVGSDERDYDLEPDDVVTLPESNADLLIEQDAAREI